MLNTLDIALARQPIFDCKDQLVGYELLYRHAPEARAAVPRDGGSGIQMSSDTIANAFLGMGLHRVTGGKRAFINVDRVMLLEGHARLLDPREVVLELLETVGGDPEVVAACEALIKDGYTLALDDFTYDRSYEPLLRLASIVKVDVLGKSSDQLRRDLGVLRRFGVRCLAERVESAAMRATCAQLGFGLFQGYFFSRPEILSGREIPVGHANLIRLLNMLREPSKSDAELEEVFRSDLALTHRLLRMVNCAGTGHWGVSSIGHGIRLLGRTALHRWMALLLVSSLSTTRGSTQDELVEMAMIRARFCELLTESAGRSRQSEASFVAGLFSLLDALLHVSMRELVERLHVTAEIEQALLAREGPYAPTLRIAEAYESAQWSALFSTADAAGVAVDNLPDLYLRAVEWARRCRAETA